MSDQLISVDRARKSFGPIHALHDVSMQVRSGEVVGLIGENGCGKSTLLKSLAGLARLDGGTVTIAGHALGVESKAATSYLPDRPSLPSRATVTRCLSIHQRMYGDLDFGRAHHILGMFGLDPSRRVGAFSKGQQEKVHIALTMARCARVYLLDEPLSGVDPLSREDALRVIVESLDPESTLVIATHLVDDISTIVDRVLIMRSGQVLDDFDPEQIRESHRETIVDRLRKVYAA